METNEIHQIAEKSCDSYPFLIVGVFIALYFVIMGFLVTFIHTCYLSTHDLAIFEQSFWSTVHNVGFFTNTVDSVYLCSFGAHNSPVLLILLPLYMIFQNPLLFPMISTILLGSAAIPLFLIARSIFSGRFSYIIVFIYLLSPAIHGINLYNFSTISFVPLLFFLCWYGLLTKRWKLYIIAGLSLVIVREDVALLAAMIGVYGLFFSGENTGKFRRCHIILMCTAIIFALISMVIIIPFFSHAPSLSSEYSVHLFDNLQLHTDLRIELFAKTFSPLLFIPFAAPEVLLVGIFQFLEVFLSPQVSFLDMQFHYPGMFQPVVILATLYGMKRICSWFTEERWKNIGRLLDFFLIIGALFGFLLFSPLMAYLTLTPSYLDQSHSEKFKILDSIIEKIPDDAIIVTQDNIIPHLAQRKEVYLYGYHPEADYIILETGTGYANPFGDDIKKYKNWTIINKENEIIVLSNPHKQDLAINLR